MDVPTTFRLLGPPGIARLFLVIAAGGAGLPAANILFRDVYPGKRPWLSRRSRWKTARSWQERAR